MSAACFPLEEARSADPRSGAERRHHARERSPQGSMREGARKAGIPKPASRRSLRHSFAARLPESGYDMRTVRKLTGRKDVRTTMIHTHVPNRGGGGVKSPAGVLRYLFIRRHLKRRVRLCTSEGCRMQAFDFDDFLSMKRSLGMGLYVMTYEMIARFFRTYNT